MALMISTTRFTTRNVAPMTSTTAQMEFRSLVIIALAPYLEKPGQLKTRSTRNALPTMDAMSMPITVMTEVLDGLNRYRFISTFSGRP